MLTIMLHRVLPELRADCYYTQRGTAISRRQLEILLNESQRRGLPLVTSRPVNGQPAICLTFDDGYADNAWAFDRILKAGGRAWLFPVKTYVQQRFSVMDDFAAQLRMYAEEQSSFDLARVRQIIRQVTPNRYRYWRERLTSITQDRCDAELFLNEKDLKQYSAAGIEMGLHGVTHRIWSNLSWSELAWEIRESEDWLTELTGTRPLGACFPHGKEPSEQAVTSLLSAYDCFGVDKPYSQNQVIRRFWLRETHHIGTVLDDYLRRK